MQATPSLTSAGTPAGNDARRPKMPGRFAKRLQTHETPLSDAAAVVVIYTHDAPFAWRALDAPSVSGTECTHGRKGETAAVVACCSPRALPPRREVGPILTRRVGIMGGRLRLGAPACTPGPGHLPLGSGVRCLAWRSSCSGRRGLCDSCHALPRQVAVRSLPAAGTDFRGAR